MTVYVQKIIKIGNSLGVIIPAPVCKSLGIKVGDEVIVEADPESRIIVVIPKKYIKGNVTPGKLLEIARFSEKYKSVLKALSKIK